MVYYRASGILSLALTLALLLAPGTVDAAGEKSHPSPVASRIHPLGYYSLPLDSAATRPMIWGLVDGRPAFLLIDSGFSFTTFDRQVMRYFEPLPKVADQIADPFWGRVSGTNWHVLHRLDLYRAQFTNMPVHIMDLSMGRAHGTARSHGILGVDFLFRNRALIFCGEMRLLLSGHKLGVEERGKLEDILRSAGYTEVTLDKLPMFAWAVTVRMGDQELKMMVDTGAERTLLDERAASAAKVHPAWGPNSMELSGVSGRQSTFSRANARNFTIGSYHESEYQFMVGDVSPWNPVRQGESLENARLRPMMVQGILGFDYLRSRQAVIDFQAGKLWLRPPAK